MPNFSRTDESFRLLPLKPPGEPGYALIKHFETADLMAALQVGKEASNEKEVDSYRCAMGWEDWED